MKILALMLLTFNCFALTDGELRDRLAKIKDLRGAIWKAGIDAPNDVLFIKKLKKTKDEALLIKLEKGDAEFSDFVSNQKAEREARKQAKRDVKALRQKVSNSPSIDPDIKKILIHYIDSIKE
jgi:hypothetical protein